MIHEALRAQARRMRLLDVLTIVVLGIAVVVALRRILPNRSSAEAERELIGHEVGRLKLIPAGDTLAHEINFADGIWRVVFLYARTCSVCDQQKPGWHRVADALPASTALYGVSVIPGDSGLYITKPAVSEWYTETARELLAAFRTRGVPATFAVDDRGTIRFARLGVLRDEDAGRLIHLIEDSS